MELTDLVREINAFRDERDWRQFHNAKDLALSTSLEASELLEHFQWRSAEEAIAHRLDGIEEELADVLIYALMLCDDLGFDPSEIIQKKLTRNAQKYPAEKAKGRRDKYNEL
jgi:NTP pyrophosphatase (non-canonical NTP hydrolase)